jgi:dynein assembly factor 3
MHLQICPYDCRHSLATISTKARYAAAGSTSKAQQQQHQLQLYVYESEPEGLARHMLLLMLLFDASLTARDRAEMFVELHGNTLLRQRTAEWASELREL